MLSGGLKRPNVTKQITSREKTIMKFVLLSTAILSSCPEKYL
jgi:hypothetical protein